MVAKADEQIAFDVPTQLGARRVDASLGLKNIKLITDLNGYTFSGTRSSNIKSGVEIRRRAERCKHVKKPSASSCTGSFLKN